MQKLVTLIQIKRCLVLQGRFALVKSIVIHLANNVASGVQRLMSQSRLDGLATNANMHRLRQAVDDTYRVEGYSEKEFALAILPMGFCGQAMLDASR